MIFGAFVSLFCIVRLTFLWAVLALARYSRVYEDLRDRRVNGFVFVLVVGYGAVSVLDA